MLAGPSDPEADAVEATKIWAHAAGVNALSVDTFENRMYVDRRMRMNLVLIVGLDYSLEVLIPRFSYGIWIMSLPVLVCRLYVLLGKSQGTNLYCRERLRCSRLQESKSRSQIRHHSFELLSF